MESLVQCGAFSGKLLQILQTDFDRNVLAEHKKEIASHLAIAVANVISIVLSLKLTENSRD